MESLSVKLSLILLILNLSSSHGLTISQDLPRNLKHQPPVHRKMWNHAMDDTSTCLTTAADMSTYFQTKSNIERNSRESPGSRRRKEILGYSFKGDPSPIQDLSFSDCSAYGLQKCNCFVNQTLSIMTCPDVETFDELKSIFNSQGVQPTEFNIFIYKPDFLILGNGDIFLSNTFGGFSFKEVYIEDTSVVTVENEALSGSEGTLTVLSFYDNSRLAEFPFHQLKIFQILEDFKIEHGRITSIPSLGSLPNLKHFGLEDNEVSTITDLAFGSLPSLSQLVLYGNRLEEITSGMLFFTADNPRVFLQFNELVDIASFTGTQPVQLDLSFNNLTTFPQNVYAPILDRILTCSYTSSFIDVTFNPMDCLEMEWVYTDDTYSNYVLSNCQEFYESFEGQNS